MFIDRRLLSLAALTLVPLSVGAQPLGKVVVTPYVGVYAPNNEVATANLAGSSSGLAATLEHRTGLALGATGAYWFTPRVGMEVGGLYARSAIKGQLGAFSMSENAGLFLGATKLMVGLFPATSEFQLRLGVGPAIITRFGGAYSSDGEGELTGRTDFGGAISLCTKVPVGQGVALRLRVENYLYQARLGYKNKLNPAASYTFDKRLQSDFVLSVGLQVGLIR